jgi:hypothetical protein
MIVSMSAIQGILLNDLTMTMLANSNLDLPFVILNEDEWEERDEPHAHRIRCQYLNVNRRDGMQPDSKIRNRTGRHWLLLDVNLPPNATRDCRCWR